MLEEVGKTSRGYTIFVQKTEHGGNRYLSDEIGGGVCVYDALCDPESVMLALKVEKEKQKQNLEIVERYTFEVGDTKFQGRSIPIGVFSVVGYYKKAANSFEKQFADNTGCLFIDTRCGGESLLHADEVFSTREAAQKAYNERISSYIDLYEGRLAALKSAMK